jgi:hypothetical protein
MASALLNHLNQASEFLNGARALDGQRLDSHFLDSNSLPKSLIQNCVATWLGARKSHEAST